jgi:hypothetical protein
MIKSTWINVTPALARKWLDKNDVNRRVRDGNLDRLIRDMQAGDYRLTHQGIAFDPTVFSLTDSTASWPSRLQV